MATKTIVSAGIGASLLALASSVVIPNIQAFEGTKSTAYRDIGGILTVCSGHTGSDVVVNKVYSPTECRALTQEDVNVAEAGVLRVSPQLKYHPLVLASAISFSYNVGVGDYDKSSVAANFNKGNFVAGCSSLLKYTYAGGKYSAGLFNRRKQEYTICMSTLTPGGLSNVGTTT